MDECLLGVDNCGGHNKCVNKEGSFVCVTNAGGKDDNIIGSTTKMCGINNTPSNHQANFII